MSRSPLLQEILELADKGYRKATGGGLAYILNPDGSIIGRSGGDPLARFVANELIETFEEDSTREEAFEIAHDVMERARVELQLVVDEIFAGSMKKETR